MHINIAEPMDIYKNHNGKSTFENKVEEYINDVKTFRRHSLKFIGNIEEEHEAIIRQMEIDTN